MRSHPMCASMRPTDEGRRQIPASSLAADPKALPEIIGPWTRDLEALSRGFANSGDVPHVVIDGFFSRPFAQALSAAFPSPDAPDIWHVYDNPLERKRACSDVARMPAVLRDAVCALCGPSMVEAVRRITGLEHASALQADPHCHGGGLHSHGTGDKLDLHWTTACTRYLGSNAALISSSTSCPSHGPPRTAVRSSCEVQPNSQPARASRLAS